MRLFRIAGVALVTVVVAAALGSGAGANARHVAQIDLSSKRGVDTYLRSLGLNPTRFVIQRGAFNYAGARCPGKKWNCTTATRVVQISTAAPGGNALSCSDAQCAAVQAATSGGNSYTCNQTATTAAGLQSCIVVQKLAPGSKSVNKNTVNVTQTVTQSASNTAQAAQQVVKITQNNDSGPSQATVAQQIDQSQDAGNATTAAQGETAMQSLYVAQCSPAQTATDVDGNPSCDTTTAPAMSGSIGANVTQKVNQNAIASSATGGSQRQESTMNGHVSQWSTSSASASVAQTESQNVTSGHGVLQTQIGPMGVTPTRHTLRGGALKGGQYCCTQQGTNPSDTFSVTQSSSQTQTAPLAFLRGVLVAASNSNANYHGEENQTASCGTYGRCTRSQSHNGAGQQQTDGGIVPLNNFCSNGVCSDGQNLATALAYTGDTTAMAGASTTLAGTLANDPAGTPLAGQDLTLTVRGTGVTCGARTDSTGKASCSVTAPTTPASYTVDVAFAGAGPYLPKTAIGTLVVSATPTHVEYTGPTAGPTNQATTISASLLTGTTAGSGTPVVGRTLAFSVGGASCNGTTGSTGSASCSLTPTGIGALTLGASFAGDSGYAASSYSGTFYGFAYLDRGSFVTGAANASAGAAVTFWSSQWSQANGVTAPSSFAGFADGPSPPACSNTGWTSGGGNSAPPPSAVPGYMAVIGTSSVKKTGSGISGNIVNVLVVRTDAGYSTGPGGRGTGTVVAVYRTC